MSESFSQNFMQMQLLSFAAFGIILCILYLTGMFKEGRFFSYHDRLSRWPFFKKIVFCFFTFIVIVIPTIVLASTNLDSQGMAMSALIALVVAPFYTYGLITTIRRLHDLNISGKLFLVYVVVLMIFNLVVFSLVGNDIEKLKLLQGNLAFQIISTISGIIQIALLIILLFIRGSIGSNNYGPDPLEKPIIERQEI